MKVGQAKMKFWTGKSMGKEGKVGRVKKVGFWGFWGGNS